MGDIIMEKNQYKRDSAMDIVRCVALFCVVAVHFFLNTGFYEEIVTGTRMYIMVLLRTGFMVCVPLFMVLSGYLMCFKKPEQNYFFKIKKTLGIYVLASIACVIYRNLFSSNPVSIKIAIVGLFGFYTAPYSWYIEMYIGLFFLMPFINELYHNLNSQNTKKKLVFVLFILTSLPSIVNIWRIFDLQWWVLPSSSSEYYELIPNWWESIYPITYYCIGCYLREYPIKIKQSTKAFLIIVIFFVSGTFSYYRSYGSQFVDGIWQSYGSAINVVLTVLLFSFISGINCESFSTKAKKRLAWFSNLCLGAYLVSWIFDQIIYNIVNIYEPIMQKRLNYFIIAVPTIYICSLALSAVINKIYDLFMSQIQHKSNSVVELE